MVLRSDESRRFSASALIGQTPQEALSFLGSAPDGLLEIDAAARLERDGLNQLPAGRRVGLVRQFARQLTHFFALMLWAAALLSFVGGLPQLGWAIIIVVVVNGIFSFVQEFRAERATRALASLLPDDAMVIRDGRSSRIPAEELVVGDVILLREGDRISADGRLINAIGLKVDNSTLTGESEPVELVFDPMIVAPDEEIEATNLVFAGSYVSSGSGSAVIFRTGRQTRLGAISQLTSDVTERETPLRVDLNRAVKVIAAVAVGAGVAFFAVSLALGTPARDGFLFSVGVIVALVPEGLLPTLSLSLAMGATRMARRGALVRHLEAVETLGATTVICTDKTGTLTANQMTARALWTSGRLYEVTGSGYDPTGTLLVDGRPPSDPELQQARRLLRAAALCQDARIEQVGNRWRCVGDPTEGALIVVAGKGGIDPVEEARRAPRVMEFPFESARGRMSTVHIIASGDREIITKGAPEILLDLVDRLHDGTGVVDLDGQRRQELLAQVELLAGRGMRVLAFAQKNLRRVETTSPSEAEVDMELLGLIGMADPIRPQVPEAIERCKRAGIAVIMITGDHPATAMSIARQAGIRTGTPLIGGQLPKDDNALAGLLLKHPVLARVAPEQKLRISRVLQEAGEVVAMTGDGVNDAPALRQADIGVAMGFAGTDVAREAADLVLLDDDFTHIVEAVEEGRAAFDNIRRFLTYHLTDNIAELAPFLVWAVSGGVIPLVLSVLQILALDIGTDLLPALALGAEQPGVGTMKQPPRSRSAHLLDRSILARSFGFLGPVEAILSLALLPVGAALFFGWRFGDPLPASGSPLTVLSTMVFAAIVLMQVVNAFECRNTSESALRSPWSNRLLVGAALSEMLILVLFVYVPFLRDGLGNHSLTREWVLIAVTPLIFLASEEARKNWARRKQNPKIQVPEEQRGRRALHALKHPRAESPIGPAFTQDSAPPGWPAHDERPDH